MSAEGHPREDGTQDAAARRALREAAARWHERLRQEPVAERIRRAFSNWLDKSAAHREAYEAVDRAWRLARSGAHDPSILALRHEAALRLTQRSDRRARWYGYVAALLIIVSGVAITARQLAPFEGWLDWRNTQPREYRTALGERLSITLEDGSQVTLNTDSFMRLAFAANERRVVLDRGQALFEVAKDPARPFVVETAQRRFVAVGTAFDVRIDGKRVQVTMLEGTVRVERARANGGAPQTDGAAEESMPQVMGHANGARTALPIIATITAGEQLTVLDERQDRILIADPHRVTSWRRGQVIFDDVRLADAIAEINRYSPTRIVLANEALADLRISGAFVTGRPTVFVEAMTAYFPVDVAPLGESALLLSKREEVSSGR